MSVGDRLVTPDYNGTRYSDMEVVDETAANGVKQMARLVKVVGDDGSTQTGIKDNGPGWTSSRGVAGATFASADASGADAAVTDAPTVGQKLVITDIMLSVDTAMRIDFEEEDSAGVLLSVYMAANSFLQITPRSKFKLPTVNKKLQIRTSVAGNVSVTTFYHSET